MSLQLRQADPDDAEHIAHIIREVSGGVTDFLLRNLSLFLNPEKLLAAAIMETGNPVSHENVLLLEHEGVVAGLILAYPWDQHGVSSLLRRLVPKKKIKILEGMLEVADKDSLYINTLWVDAPWRGSGVADELMGCAILMAKDMGLAKISLHVWADNERALRFYRRHGFQTVRHFDVPRQRLLPHDGGNMLLSRPVDVERS